MVTVATPAPAKSKSTRYLVIVAVAVLALIAGWMLGGGKTVKKEVAYIAGMEEYVYGCPLVMMDVSRQMLTAASSTGEYAAPINSLPTLHIRLTPE